MMNLVIIAGRTIIGVTAKELAIMATTFAGKAIKAKQEKVAPKKLKYRMKSALYFTYLNY